ncbi:hypothetical protein M7I_4476 [Glarea lozoyensis 74030]|uniref:Uncharacterized protein n=1 Tax=Glarea lozoyensis (strain ATCC 74030 / MF5533) TaxID=1104152 RepID=H0EPA5_GLAL7|nr:hypothetical protein M7I_4476 [Glarea lozoyensis 74030]
METPPLHSIYLEDQSPKNQAQKKIFNSTKTGLKSVKRTIHDVKKLKPFYRRE